MKLIFKLTVGITLIITMVLAVRAHLRLKREAALFDSDIQRDERVLGKALGFALQETWRTQGRETALRMLDVVEAQVDGLWIRWLPDGPPSASAPGAAWPPDQGHYLHRRERVTLADGSAGVIELAESLATRDAYLQETVRGTVQQLLVTILLCSLAAFVMGYWLVGRSVRALVQMAREVGHGNLTHRIPETSRDEFGLLAREFNLMAGSLEDTLEKLVEERRARRSTEEQLRHSERLATVGTLASGIAHEMGTPLNVISGRARLIEKSSEADAQVVESARIIHEQTSRIIRIISQLLEFARQRGVQKRTVDLRHLVEGTLGMLETIARKRDVRLTHDSAEPVVVPVDSNQLQQVVTNLVLNGIQAMPQGGDLSISCSRIRRPAGEDPGGTGGEFVRLSVEDRGVGIPPENMPFLFDPFFTTKEVGEGTGLGLSIVHGIVSEHSGWIDVTSSVGSGTRFDVHLPVS